MTPTITNSPTWHEHGPAHATYDSPNDRVLGYVERNPVTGKWGAFVLQPHGSGKDAGYCTWVATTNDDEAAREAVEVYAKARGLVAS